jgi:hypothetical protein
MLHKYRADFLLKKFQLPGRKIRRLPCSCCLLIGINDSQDSYGRQQKQAQVPDKI